MTPMACSTAFLESRLNTAGWLIHSRLESSSASKAATARVSMLELCNAFRSFDWPGELLDFRSGTSDDVGDEFDFSPVVELAEGGGPGDREAGGGCDCPPGVGKGGSPPLPRPLRILRVSLRR